MQQHIETSVAASSKLPETWGGFVTELNVTKIIHPVQRIGHGTGSRWLESYSQLCYWTWLVMFSLTSPTQKNLQNSDVSFPICKMGVIMCLPPSKCLEPYEWQVAGSFGRKGLGTQDADILALGKGLPLPLYLLLLGLHRGGQTLNSTVTFSASQPVPLKISSTAFNSEG